MADQRPYPTVTPYLLYEDVAAALEWLHHAFGFTERLRFSDDDGVVNHAEVVVGGDGVVMLGHPGPGYRNPRRSGAGSALVHVVVADVDAHHQRAVNAGAEVLRPPRGPGVRGPPLRRPGPRRPPVVVRAVRRGRHARGVGSPDSRPTLRRVTSR